MLKTHTTLFTLILSAWAVSDAAEISNEDFGATLSPPWSIADVTDGFASLDVNNSRYEYTGQTGAAGERSRVTMQVPTTLSATSDWTIAVSMHMDGLSSFGTELEFAGGLILNTLQLKAEEVNGDEHQIEFNLAMLDSGAIGAPFGVTHGYRFAEQLRPFSGDNTDVFNEIELTQTNTAQDVRVYLTFDSIAQSIIAGIDTGSGLTRFTDAAVDTSGWNIASGAFDIFLESQIGPVSEETPGPVGMQVTSGELYYDDLTIYDNTMPIPELSTYSLLGGLCAFGFVFIRRRR